LGLADNTNTNGLNMRINNIWWRRCSSSPAAPNRPTSAFVRRQTSPGVFTNQGSKIRRFSLTRISKVPYMLVSVEKQVYYPATDAQGYLLTNQWATSKKITFDYEMKQIDRYVYVANNAQLPV
jgi:hypothetical protein